MLGGFLQLGFHGGRTLIQHAHQLLLVAVLFSLDLAGFWDGLRDQSVIDLRAFLAAFHQLDAKREPENAADECVKMDDRPGWLARVLRVAFPLPAVPKLVIGDLLQHIAVGALRQAVGDVAVHVIFGDLVPLRF